MIAVDASQGMLVEARRLVERRGWTNVELLQQDAALLQLDEDVDAVLFSLSYAVIPDPSQALERAWERLRPSRRAVVMDVGVLKSPLRSVAAPIAKLLVKLVPGDPYARPWDDLASYGPVESESFMLGLYYVCAVQKALQP